MSTFAIALGALGMLVGLALGYYLRLIVSLGKKGSMELEIKKMMISAKEEARKILKDEKKKEEAQRQIGLQVVQAYYAIEAAQAQIDQAEAEAAAAERAYELVEIKYRQGQANLIELTNARTQWTNAQESEIIAHYDLLIRQAELERATAQ